MTENKHSKYIEDIREELNHLEDCCFDIERKSNNDELKEISEKMRKLINLYKKTLFICEVYKKKLNEVKSEDHKERTKEQRDYFLELIEERIEHNQKLKNNLGHICSMANECWKARIKELNKLKQKLDRMENKNGKL